MSLVHATVIERNYGNQAAKSRSRHGCRYRETRAAARLRPAGPSLFIRHVVVDLLQLLFEIFVKFGLFIVALCHFLTNLDVQFCDD
jgi:hypothetical protein